MLFRRKQTTVRRRLAKILVLKVQAEKASQKQESLLCNADTDHNPHLLRGFDIYGIRKESTAGDLLVQSCDFSGILYCSDVSLDRRRYLQEMQERVLIHERKHGKRPMLRT